MNDPVPTGSVQGQSERTCDRCARATSNWATIDEAYICAECQAEIAVDEAEVSRLRAENERLRGALQSIAGKRRVTAAFCQSVAQAALTGSQLVSGEPGPDYRSQLPKAHIDSEPPQRNLASGRFPFRPPGQAKGSE